MKNLSLEQEEIWKIEEEYWVHFTEGNTESMGSLCHADFVLWPLNSPAPCDLAASKASLNELFKNVEIVSYQLDPQSVVVRGNLAVILLSVSLALKNPEGQTQTNLFRVSHTWVKEGKDWKFISGMSAPL